MTSCFHRLLIRQRARDARIINQGDVLTCSDDYQIWFSMKFCNRIFIFFVIVMSSFPIANGFAVEVEPMIIKERCVVCHTADRICVNLGRGDDFWKPTVKRMASNGAKVSETEIASFSMLLSGEPQAVAQALACPTAQEGGTVTSASNKVPILVALVHPAFMTLALLLSFWVAYQGVNRARISLFKHKVRFNWKGHVRYGIVVMSTWFFGMIAGGIMAKLIYGATEVTGDHRTIAMIMLPMILFGEGSGLYMKFKKGPRKILPIFHGANNLMLVLLACMQLFTGFYLVRGLF